MALNLNNIYLVVIICIFNLITNLGGFMLFYFNNSKNQNNSLIPKLIITGFAFQSIISYCCITLINVNDFITNNPLPKILSIITNRLKIFFELYNSLIGLLKLFNALLFIIILISNYLNEIFYCVESIYLFQNPVSNTKNRKIIYILLNTIIPIIFAIHAITAAFNSIKIDENHPLWEIYENNSLQCISFSSKFFVNLSKCSKYAFGDDLRYFGIILCFCWASMTIFPSILILLILFSIIIILNSIKIQSKLFIYEKQIFQTRHIIYSILGSIFSIGIIFLVYILKNKNFEQNINIIDNYELYYLLIIIDLNLFGVSNAIIRLLEIDFFHCITFSKNVVKEDYNEKAIQQFMKLIGDNEQKEKLKKKIEKIEDQNTDISKNFENIDFSDKNKKELKFKNRNSINNTLPLSSQIACDFLSESVYYIISCIINIANNGISTSILQEQSYISCNEHILIPNSNKDNFNYKLKINDGNDSIIIDDKEQNLIINSDESDNIKENNLNEGESKESYIPFNQWETRTILLKQAKFGNFFTNLFSRKIKIIEYSPEIFRNILHFDKIDETQLIKSFNLIDNILKLSSFKGSEGKSGSIFFETHDKKFIIKTIREDELESMYNKLLEKYYNLFSAHSYSNLTRIYGLYTLILGVSKVHVVIMENIFPFDKKALICKYDLKGSSLGRRTKKLFDKKGVTLKDNDYIELSNKYPEYTINLTEQGILMINNVLSYDLDILEEADLMDYSFFVCIAKKKDIKEEEDKIIIKDRIFESINDDYVYILGIIDYLTEFGISKKIENIIKKMFNKKKYSMSCVNPKIYRKRFITFLKNCNIVKN